MAGTAQRIGGGILGLFIMAGTAMGQQPPAAPGKAASQPAFSQEGFKAEVDKAVAAENARRAATPALQLQAQDGGKICGATPEVMLQAREFADKFSRFDRKADKMYFSRLDGEKRVEYPVTEKQFSEIATDLALKPPQRGQGDCAMRWWKGMAIQDATQALTQQ